MIIKNVPIFINIFNQKWVTNSKFPYKTYYTTKRRNRVLGPHRKLKTLRVNAMFDFTLLGLVYNFKIAWNKISIEIVQT